MRLYDRIRHTGTILGPKEMTERVQNDVAQITRAVPFDVSNVTDYLAGLGEEKRRDFRIGDLPCVVPPFDVTFVESRLPIGGNWEWFSGEIGDTIRAFGSLCFAIDLVADFSAHSQVEVDDPQAAANAFAHNILGRAKVEGEKGHIELYSDVRWMISCYSFLDMRKGVVLGPVMAQGFFLGPDGAAVRTNLPEGHMAGFSYTFMEMGEPESAAMFARQLLMPAFFAFSLTHCRNVNLVQHEGVFPSRQARREAERRGDPPPEKFYTLEIGAMTKALSTEGGVHQDGLKRAMHICRGHFSEYSEEKPLFGKYAGRFWVPAHVRGTAEVGKVVKDYAVKAPRQAA